MHEEQLYYIALNAGQLAFLEDLLQNAFRAEEILEAIKDAQTLDELINNL